MKFRERDGVCISYEVRGIPGSEQFPYIDDVGTLKEAVAIARTYPDVYQDGSATHIVRRYSKKYPDAHQFHHSSGPTHRWRVDTYGQLQLIEAYRREWPCTRLGVIAYAEKLPAMPNSATTLRGQLLDLASIANRIGLKDAGRALVEHAYGRRCLPDFGRKEEGGCQIAQEQTKQEHNETADKPVWRRIVDKVLQG